MAATQYAPADGSSTSHFGPFRCLAIPRATANDTQFMIYYYSRLVITMALSRWDAELLTTLVSITSVCPPTKPIFGLDFQDGISY